MVWNTHGRKKNDYEICLIKIYHWQLIGMERCFKITSSITTLYLVARNNEHVQNGDDDYNDTASAVIFFSAFFLLACKALSAVLLKARISICSCWFADLPGVRQDWAKWAGHPGKEQQGRQWHRMSRPMPWNDPPCWTCLQQNWEVFTEEFPYRICDWVDLEATIVTEALSPSVTLDTFLILEILLIRIALGVNVDFRYETNKQTIF